MKLQATVTKIELENGGRGCVTIMNEKTDIFLSVKFPNANDARFNEFKVGERVNIDITSREIS